MIPLTLEFFCLLQLLSNDPDGREYLAKHGSIVEIIFAALKASVDCGVSEVPKQDRQIRNSMQWMAILCLSSLSENKSCADT